MLNETHDASLQSWVRSANDRNAEFPVQNLPFCVFRRAGSNEPFRVGIGIGDAVIPAAAIQSLEGVDARAAEAAVACESSSLNGLMALGPGHWQSLRLAWSRAL